MEASFSGAKQFKSLFRFFYFFIFNFNPLEKSFRNGDVLLNIQVTDEAGNYAIGEIGLMVEY